nr:MAG TPA: hypothetical protein [Caudoviricetes sp.]DAV60160.1 MAG TPA: hypothetical protein [Caudoviricetes sp.]
MVVQLCLLFKLFWKIILWEIRELEQTESLYGTIRLET